MEDQLIFVVGPPRSGSTLLARMIGAHSLIYGRPEPHLLTPLAHLGYYAKVDKAPYDAVLAAEAQREFVARSAARRAGLHRRLPRLLRHALPAHAATKPEKRFFLDKTPAYALVLDFIARIYPDAKYVVLTRHPLAVFSSYAESFFNGDYAAAQAYNPILERYVPAIAKFLRQRPAPLYHVVYEQLVADPERVLGEIFAFLGVPNEPQAVEYGRDEPTAQGLGDPIGVKQAHAARPPSRSTSGRPRSPRAPDRLQLCRQIIARLDPDDLAHVGSSARQPVGAARRRRRSGRKAPARRRFDRYRLERLSDRQAARAWCSAPAAAPLARHRRASAPTCCCASRRRVRRRRLAAGLEPHGSRSP